MDKKRVIDGLYKDYSKATSSNAGKTAQNDAQDDLKFKDHELEKEEKEQRFFKKIFKNIGQK